MTPTPKKPTPPIAHPIAPRSEAASAHDSGPVREFRESTPLSLAAPEAGSQQANNRSGTIGMRRLQELVNDRDLEILRSVDAHRLLRTSHVYDLHFWNHASWASGIRACNRVLNRLRDHRLLRRLDRAVGGTGGGSHGFVWAIDVAGERLLRHLDHEGRGRQRPFEPSTLFLNHTLAIADRRIELEAAGRAGQMEVVQIRTEPANWRTFVGSLGASVALKPDLEATTASGEWEYDWFIEQDMGTESGTALIRKCWVYQRYYESGREQARTGTFPRVVWLVPDGKRVALLRRLLASEDGIASELFIITTTPQFISTLLSNSEQGQSADSERRTP